MVVTTTTTKMVVHVQSIPRHSQGPYLEDIPPANTAVRFTATQVEAIRSGSNPAGGLTMIVGPPGTGKTDVAVQIICNLYHNYPTQKILIVTHSNAALNDLFEKIMEVSSTTTMIFFHSFICRLFYYDYYSLIARYCSSTSPSIR